MQRIVINTRIGGFGLSEKAIAAIKERKGMGPDEYCDRHPYEEYQRADPVLVAVVEELGEEAYNPSTCTLKIVDVPDDVEWQLEVSEAGPEWIAEKHRTWD